MIPNITRGGRMAGLMVYLAGEGRENEHQEQHLVAGDSAIMTMYGYDVLDRNTALAIAHDLDRPHQHFGVEVQRKVTSTDRDTGVVSARYVDADVWHCSLSLGPEDGQLSDEKWGQIAEEFVDRMGFTEASNKAACRWVAVRHGASKNGNDHVHIAVSLVREDGTKASVHNDRPRAQNVCRELEREHSLTVLSLEGRELGERGVKPPEHARAVRHGVEVESHRLERAVRASAAAAVDEGEFVRRMRQAGVLIRPRFAAGRDDVVAGYSVALRPEKGEQVVWHGGGKLARDLTLPRLREGWPDSPQSAQSAVDEWRATAKNPWQYRPVAAGREESDPAPELWAQYTDEIRQMRAAMQAVPIEDRAGWAHLARDTAGAFAAWSQRVEATPGPLAATARDLARTAQIRAHESKPKRAGRVSSGGAAALLMMATTGGKGTMAEALMLRQLAASARAIMDMHRAAGDMRRAIEIDQTLVQQYRQVRDRLPQIPAERPEAPLSPEAARVRGIVEVVQRGQPRPGAELGKPVPSQLPPARRTSPNVVPHERDGMDR